MSSLKGSTYDFQFHCDLSITWVRGGSWDREGGRGRRWSQTGAMPPTSLTQCRLIFEGQRSTTLKVSSDLSRSTTHDKGTSLARGDAIQTLPPKPYLPWTKGDHYSGKSAWWADDRLEMVSNCRRRPLERLRIFWRAWGVLDSRCSTVCSRGRECVSRVWLSVRSGCWIWRKFDRGFNFRVGYNAELTPI